MEYIYGCKRGDYFKVGYSTDPSARLAALRVNGGGAACPRDMDFGQPFEVLFVVLGDLNTEKLVHGLLDGARAVGEWFRWMPELGWLRASLPRDSGQVVKPNSAGPRPARQWSDEEMAEINAMDF